MSNRVGKEKEVGEGDGERKNRGRKEKGVWSSEEAGKGEKVCEENIN